MNRFSVCVLALVVLAGAAVIPFSASAQQYRLRIGHDQPAGTMYDEGHTMFRKLVEERSAGRIKVDVFPAARENLRNWESGLYFIAFDDLPQRSVERSSLDLNTNLPGGRAMTTG